MKLHDGKAIHRGEDLENVCFLIQNSGCKAADKFKPIRTKASNWLIAEVPRPLII